MASSDNCVKFWLDNAGKYPVLDRDEVLRLARIVQSAPDGSKARQKAIEKLVKHNLKLIPKVAMRALKSKRKGYHSGRLPEDLFQSGVIGLQRAVELFDPTRGYAFSTYAMGWIHQSIYRDIYTNMSPIRVPENTLREYYNFSDPIKRAAQNKKIDAKKIERYAACAMALNCRSSDAVLIDPNSSETDSKVEFGVSEDLNEVTDSVLDLVKLSDCCYMSKTFVFEYYQLGLSHEAIAFKYGCDLSNVENRINTCLADLKEKISVV